MLGYVWKALVFVWIISRITSPWKEEIGLLKFGEEVLIIRCE